MKKTLKTMIVLAILVTLLASPITVCASAVSEVIQGIENTNQTEADATTSKSVMETTMAGNEESKDGQTSHTTLQQTQSTDAQPGIKVVELVQSTDTQPDVTTVEPVQSTDTQPDVTTVEPVQPTDTQPDVTTVEPVQPTDTQPVQPADTQVSDTVQGEPQEEPTTKEPLETTGLQVDVTTEDTNESVDAEENVTEIVPKEPQDTTGEMEMQVDLEDDSLLVDESAFGKLELEIILRLPTQEPFTVKLQKDDQTALSKLDKQDDRLYYHFDQLELGTYTLEISGKNYVTYTQTLEIGANVTKIILSNGHDINDVLVNSQVKYGVVGLGDINRGWTNKPNR